MEIYKRLTERSKNRKGGIKFLISEESCNKFETLYLENKSDYEIGRILNIPAENLFYIRKILNIKKAAIHNSQKELVLSELEEAVLMGTILGDACVTKINKRHPNSKITFAHKFAHKEYFEYKRELLKNIQQTIKYNEVFDKRTGNTYYSLTYTSFSHPYFTNLRKLFYPNNKKIIPIEYLYDKYTTLSLAIQFMDDGFKSSKNSKYIATDCFDKENLIMFSSMLNDKFQLNSRVTNSNRILLPKQSNDKFLELVSPYICNIMRYKL
jgi:hypothetical protein